MAGARYLGSAAAAVCFATSVACGQLPRIDEHGLQAEATADLNAQVDRQGDALPQGALARFGSRRLRHEGAAGIALSPDARVLASVSARDVRLWDVRTGQEFSWYLHGANATAQIAQIRFSPDGAELFTGLRNGRLQVWHLATGRLLSQNLIDPVMNDGSVTAKSASDGTLRASLQQHLIAIEGAAGRQPLPARGHDGAVERLAISADGRFLASAGADGRLILWDVGRAEARHTGQAPDVLGLAFSPDGKFLATGEGKRTPVAGVSGAIRLWDLEEGRVARLISVHGHGVYALAFAPDGKQLLSAGADNRARLWDTDTWQELRQFTPRRPRDPDHTINPWSVAFSPDGRVFATCAADDEEINLWTAGTQDPVRIARHWLLAFNADGKTLLAHNHFGHLSVREVASGRELGTSKTLGWFPTPDGKMLLARSAEARSLVLKDWALGRDLLEFPLDRGQVSAAVFAADGRTLFSGSTLGTILAWSVPPPAVTRLEPLWSMLLGESDSEAAKAVNSLANETPRLAVGFLRTRVQPIGSRQLDAALLIADLDDKRFAVRNQATRQLETLGTAVEPLIRAALKKPPSLEVERRLQILVQRLATAPRVTPEQRAALRSVTILERLATPDATEVLHTLADGYALAPVTRAAQAALERLASRKK